MSAPFARACLLAAAALAASLLLGAQCGGPAAVITLDAPREAWVVDDSFVDASARVGAVIDPASVAVDLDGVDLVAALGLVPPFTDASGLVVLPSGPVDVSGFDYEPSAKLLRLTLAGLAPGAHTLLVEGVRSTNQLPASDAATFTVVGPLALASAEAASSAGLRSGAQARSGGGFLLHQTLGGLAAPAAARSGGGELRSGFAAVAGELAEP